MFGPTHLLFSLTKAYAACIPPPFRAAISGGVSGPAFAAARITKAIVSVAERETPHWQLESYGYLVYISRDVNKERHTGSKRLDRWRGPGQQKTWLRENLP
jgi:hypothetical protein